MGWGDEIVAAGQAQRLFAEQGHRVLICGADRKPRWHPIWDGNPAICRPGESGTVLVSGPGARPYITYPFTKQSGWTFNTAFKCRDHVAKLYLTPAELQLGIDALAKYGPYVLIEPYTKHDNFRWPMSRWQQMVAACPDLTFVQHVHDDSPLVAGAYVEPATFREACGLIAASELYVRSESGLCHAAAALGKQQVTLFGGCMDAEVMAGYDGQTVIVDRGPRSPCGSWKTCAHCLDAMDRISVDDVIHAMRRSLRQARAA